MIQCLHVIVAHPSRAVSDVYCDNNTAPWAGGGIQISRTNTNFHLKQNLHGVVI